MKFWGGAMQSPSDRIATNKAQNSYHLCYTLVFWKQKEYKHQKLALVFSSDSHTYYYWLWDFIFKILAISFSILANTLPMDAAHLSLHSPCRDLLFIKRKVEFAFPRKCCTLSIYQHLIESINMNLQIFLNLIM